MENYPPNSHKYKERQKAAKEEKRVEKVISGSVKTKKKNELSNVAEAFISDDASKIKSYILMDVLIPAAKKLISDIVTNGIEMLLYGSNGSPKRGTNASKISYHKYYDDRNGRDRFNNAPRARASRYDPDDVILDSRGEAELVLDKMDELIVTYNQASVADFYDLVGITGDYTDNKYGWFDLSTATVVRARNGGYMIRFPRAEPL